MRVDRAMPLVRAGDKVIVSQRSNRAGGHGLLSVLETDAPLSTVLSNNSSMLISKARMSIIWRR